jgi:hypothetical protein
MGVTFYFPIIENLAVRDEILRRHFIARKLWRRVLTSQAGEIAQCEMAVMQRRVVFAMLHIKSPGCDIDKIVPPPGRKFVEDEDSALTFFHCRTRADLGQIWTHKFSDPDSHKRFALLGPIETPNGAVELAVNFRREQQLYATQIPQVLRIASLNERGLEFVNSAYDIYLRQ